MTTKRTMNEIKYTHMYVKVILSVWDKRSQLHTKVRWTDTNHCLYTDPLSKLISPNLYGLLGQPDSYAYYVLLGKSDFNLDEKERNFTVVGKKPERKSVQI